MVANEKRDHEGRYTQKKTDSEVLAAVRAHNPAATSEVAEELDMTRQAADYRLRKLRDEGRVNSKKIAKSLVWFPAEDTTDTVASDPQPTVEPEPREQPVPEPPDPEPEASDDHQVLGVTLDELPGSGKMLEARYALLEDIVDYLEAHGPAQRREIVDEFYEDSPVGYKSESGWWNTICAALSELSDETNEVWKASPGSESSGWNYTDGRETDE